ncbi:MAG: hypothetical protein LCH96_11725 [Actinobacteria bacterium]|nr:hypothetical protein [Actinomycetota bacterium]
MASRVGSEGGRRTARRWLAGALSLAVVSGAGLASAPVAVAADPDDIVADLATAPVGAIVHGVWNNVLVAEHDDSWYISSNKGNSWWNTAIENAYRLAYLDDQYAVLSGSNDDDSTMVWVVEHSSEIRAVNEVDLGSANLRGVDADTAIDDTGDEARAIDLDTKAATTLQLDVTDAQASPSWWELGAEQALRVLVTYASDGMTPVGSSIDPTPLDGTSAGDPAITVPGGVVEAGYDANGLNYLALKKTSGKTTFEYDYCTIADGATTPVCDVLRSGISKKDSQLSMAYRVGGYAELQIAGSLYFSKLVREAKTGKVPAAKKVTGVGVDHYPDGTRTKFAQVGSSALPIVSDTTPGTGGVFEVPASGKAERFSVGPTAPVLPYELSLSATRVAGVDDRSTYTLWQRDLGTPSQEEVLSTRGVQARVSVGRTAVNGSTGLLLSDQGMQIAKLKKWAWVEELSGPYLLGRATATAKRTVLAGTRTITFGKWDLPMAVFGSRVAALTYGATDWWITIFDVSTGKPVTVDTVPLTAFERIFSVYLWGDTVLIDGTDDPTVDGSRVQVTNFVDATQSEKSFPDGASFAGLGDGVAVVQTGDQAGWQVMDTTTSALALTPLEDSADTTPAVDGAGRVAYATDSELVVHQVPGAGTSEPRALWTSAATTFNALAGETAPWKVSVDASKAVGAGALVIDGTGVVAGSSATVPVHSSADGSLRISWDGRLDDGSAAPAGSYTWKLTGFGELKDVSGAKGVEGVLTVTNKAVAYPQATPKIDPTKPATDTVLTADPGAAPTGATVAYQWYRGTKAIPGEVGETYTATSADVGKTLKVKVTFTNSLYLDSSKYSASTKKVVAAALTKGTVALSDTTATVGAPLSAVLDGWGPAPVTPTYQWYRVDAKKKAKAISKQIGKTYTPTAADVGYRIRVTVTVAKAGYVSVTATTPTSDVVAA